VTKSGKKTPPSALAAPLRAPLSAPSLSDMHAAAKRLHGVAVRTALTRFDPETATIPGAGGRAAPEIYLKLEHTQPIGSFKIRGAANALALATATEIADGIWTASAGNMAQGVAWVARARGVRCVAVVPDHAPRAKTDAIKRLGAEVIVVPFEAWWDALLTHSHPGMTGLMVHPFADNAVMAGNATIGLEIAEDQPDLDAVLVPWGGGGLALGIAAALREVSPNTKVYAVEVETAAPLTASISAGEPVIVRRTKTFIDGMGSDRVSHETWPLVKGLIAGTVVVTVQQVAAALKLLIERAGVTAEGAGAATVAAAMAGAMRGRSAIALPAKRVACVISGGNIDADVVAAIMRGAVP